MGDGGDKWSGDATRYGGIGLENQITITTGDADVGAATQAARPKETPLWMSHSTIDGTAIGQAVCVTLLQHAGAFTD